MGVGYGRARSQQGYRNVPVGGRCLAGASRFVRSISRPDPVGLQIDHLCRVRADSAAPRRADVRRLVVGTAQLQSEMGSRAVRLRRQPGRAGAVRGAQRAGGRPRRERVRRLVGPLLPPPTTEPARGRRAPDCHWRRLDDAPRTRRQNAAPVATPTPDIDPDEVRRALGSHTMQSATTHAVDGRYSQTAASGCASAEQPAPDEELPDEGRHRWCLGPWRTPPNNENQLQQAMLRRVIALERR